MRARKSVARWRAVCLTPGHHSFSTRAMPTYASAAAQMSREHPTCAYEMVCLTVASKTDVTGQLNQLLGLPTDELVGD
ncbi:hypothetical protein [Subtercola sp. YIM 133946]|uniref:hypothetical protein n=1 Tax=Subtercola sp. YIM 133946 TaxID=3118909 RepID=UPI002F92E569